MDRDCEKLLNAFARSILAVILLTVFLLFASGGVIIIWKFAYYLIDLDF